jgi:hypothetical protein
MGKLDSEVFTCSMCDRELVTLHWINRDVEPIYSVLVECPWCPGEFSFEKIVSGCFGFGDSDQVAIIDEVYSDPNNVLVKTKLRNNV